METEKELMYALIGVGIATFLLLTGIGIYRYLSNVERVYAETPDEAWEREKEMMGFETYDRALEVCIITDHSTNITHIDIENRENLFKRECDGWLFEIPLTIGVDPDYKEHETLKTECKIKW